MDKDTRIFWLDSRIGKGKIYARTKNICGLKVSSGKIQAVVQEKEKIGYHVVIQVDVLSHHQWDKILDILADKAIFIIKLLSGEMPENINDILVDMGISLFPQSRESFHIFCTCNDGNILCRHAAAVFYAFTMKLEEDPLLLFTLSGMDRKRLNDSLRERRSIRANGCKDEDQEVYGDLQSDEQLDWYAMENFWIGGMSKASINITISPPSTEEFIFNKLGEPTFFGGKRDMVRQLKRDYRRILSKALTAWYSQDEK